MPSPLGAITDSALATRLLGEVRPVAVRADAHALAAAHAARAPQRGAAPVATPAEEAEPLPLYTAGGRMRGAPQVEEVESADLVDAVGGLLAAREGGAIDLARLRALHERTGTLLDVLA